MKKTKTLLSIITCIFCMQSLYAAIDLGFAKEDGGMPGAFLSFGAGARSLGMGKAYTAVADDASAVYWNPAGLCQLNKQEATLLHALLWEETDYTFAAYAKPLYTGDYFGIGFVRLYSGGFEKTDANEKVLGETSVSEMALLVSYAKSIPLGIHLGATGKISGQQIDNKSGYGCGLDIGALWPIFDKKIRLAMTIQNLIPPKITLDEDTDTFPYTVTLGASYSISKKLLLSLDTKKIDKRDPKTHAGMEYRLCNLLAVRTGIDETELTCGFSITVKSIEIGYAYSYHDAVEGFDDLGTSHRFGLTYRWGKD